jgi:hypothetical protein
VIDTVTNVVVVSASAIACVPIVIIVARVGYFIHKRVLTARGSRRFIRKLSREKGAVE